MLWTFPFVIALAGSVLYADPRPALYRSERECRAALAEQIEALRASHYDVDPAWRCTLVEAEDPNP